MQIGWRNIKAEMEAMLDDPKNGEAVKYLIPQSPLDSIQPPEDPIALLEEIYHQEGELDALDIIVFSVDEKTGYHNQVRYSELQSCLNHLEGLQVGNCYGLMTKLAPKKGEEEDPERFKGTPLVMATFYEFTNHNYGNIVVRGKDVNRVAETFSKLERLVRKTNITPEAFRIKV